MKSRPEIYITSINLMKSDLTPQGAIYKQLASIGL
jgi:2'-5' RNA ligase